MPIEFRQRSDYYKWVVCMIEDRWWVVQADFRTGGIKLELSDEVSELSTEALPGSLLTDTGVNHGGDVSPIYRRYTHEELQGAISGVAKLFGLPVPKRGRLVLSTYGHPYVVGPTVRDTHGNERIEGVLSLNVNEREVRLRPDGIYSMRETLETQMPTLHLGANGQAMVPLVPALLWLQKWSDALGMLVKDMSRPVGWGWEYTIRISLDGSTVKGGWHQKGEEA
jgi:hypothetical protein